MFPYYAVLDMQNMLWGSHDTGAAGAPRGIGVSTHTGERQSARVLARVPDVACLPPRCTRNHGSCTRDLSLI